MQTELNQSALVNGRVSIFNGDGITCYNGLYRNLWKTQHHAADWPELSATIEAERRRMPSAERLAEHARWRDRRLRALLAHKRAAAKEID